MAIPNLVGWSAVTKLREMILILLILIPIYAQFNFKILHHNVTIFLTLINFEMIGYPNRT